MSRSASHPIRWQTLLPLLVALTLIVGVIDAGPNAVVAQSGDETIATTGPTSNADSDQSPDTVYSEDETDPVEPAAGELLSLTGTAPSGSVEEAEPAQTSTESASWTGSTSTATPDNASSAVEEEAPTGEALSPTEVIASGPTASETATVDSGGASASNDEVLPAGAPEDRTFVAVFGSGPEPLPGACWSYAVNDAGTPGATVKGPECDLDGDGRVTLTELPFGAFCFVVIPPPGFSRPAADYSFCDEFLGGGSDVTVGFLLTTTATPSPTPTRTPSPSPTPHSSPVPSEPNGRVLIQNCAVSRTYEGLTIPTGCQPVAGVTLAVTQRGIELGQFTSGPDGTFNLELPERLPFTLRYISGNGAEWVPVDLEETRLRYNEETSFLFEPAPEVDQTWTMTVRVVSGDFNTQGEPIGGACARIEHYPSGDTLLAEICDDDGDGLIVLGNLPPDDAGEYRAHLLSIPDGYQENTLPIITGVEPASADFVWTATFSLYRFRPSAVITTVNSSQQLVPGFCYFATYGNGSFASFRFCDDSDGSNDGVTRVSPLAAGGTFLMHMSHLAPRWQATTKIKQITMALTGDTPITFQVLRYGTDSTTKADLEVASVDQTGRTTFTNSHICYRLWSTTGFFYGEHCADGQESKTIFEDLSVGSYELTLVTELTSPTCLPRTIDLIEIEAGDIGTTVSTTVVFDCDYPPPPPAGCEIEKSTFRHIDIYLGTAVDSGSGDTLIRTFEMSESVSFGIGASIERDNPDVGLFTYANLAKWTEPTFLNPWNGDWQTDARAALIADYAGFGEVSPGEDLLLRESTLLVKQDFEFSESPSSIPECDAFPGAEFGIIRTNRYAIIRFIELNATVSPLEPTSTPTTTPTPQPTATPQPVVCSVPLVRTITLAYGVVKNRNDEVLNSDLQLSDDIPEELAGEIEEAIQNGTISELINNWADANIDLELWISEASQGRDAVEALRTALSGNDIELDEAIERDSIEIELGKRITYLDEDVLPEGCIIAAWGLLYSVEQPLIAKVRVIELNGNSTDPDSTPDTGSTSTPTPAPTSTPTASPTAPAGQIATATPLAYQPGSVQVNQLPITGSGSASTGFRLATLWVLLTLGGLFLTLFVRRRSASAPVDSTNPSDRAD